ncbi:MAG TPA: aminoacyl-tRNA hydrolase [Dehalococcoidia bacterium]|nr:aminoacyl-tRNA hydrolase [Dehalococcoidia bacterium]
MAEHWLIVGLGNPGKNYAETRHNVGFWCVNRLARKYNVPLVTHRLYASGRGEIEGAEVTLAKPRTYVNRSGIAVEQLLRQEDIEPARLIIICDDLDSPVGRFRMRRGGNHGGHNGLRSIIHDTGRQDFPRIRIGIGRPIMDGEPSHDPDDVIDYVLSEPTPEERRLLEEAIETAIAAIETTIRSGINVAMDRYNRG